jgi:glycerol-3-phosphate dehydrogenase
MPIVKMVERVINQELDIKTGVNLLLARSHKMEN